MQLNRMSVEISAIFDEHIIGLNLIEILCLMIKTFLNLWIGGFTLNIVLNKVTDRMGCFFNISEVTFR